MFFSKTTWPTALKLHRDTSRDPQTLICSTSGAAIFFLFFNEFLCVFTIFDFFSKTMSQIVLKLVEMFLVEGSHKVVQ